MGAYARLTPPLDRLSDQAQDQWECIERVESGLWAAHMGNVLAFAVALVALVIAVAK